MQEQNVEHQLIQVELSLQQVTNDLGDAGLSQAQRLALRNTKLLLLRRRGELWRQQRELQRAAENQECKFQVCLLQDAHRAGVGE